MYVCLVLWNELRITGNSFTFFNVNSRRLVQLNLVVQQVQIRTDSIHEILI